MSKYFPLLLAEIADIEDSIHRQYVLAEVLAEIKSLESINRDNMAKEYDGDAKFSNDYFSVVIKTPEIVTVDQTKVVELFKSGWAPELINAVFPTKYGLSKKELAKNSDFEYAVNRKPGKPTIKVTNNYDQ